MTEPRFIKLTEVAEIAKKIVEKEKEKTAYIINEISGTVLDDLGNFLDTIFYHNYIKSNIEVEPYIDEMKEDFAKDQVRDSYYDAVQAWEKKRE